MTKEELKEKEETKTEDETVTAEETETEEAPAETGEVEAEETAESEEDLAAELEAVKTELAEKADQYLRLQAEFDNFRRRTIKEKEDLRQTANADLLSDLLPVLDNLERALVHAEGSPILEGIVMVQKQLLEILDRVGLEKAGAEGEAFDPKFHDAIMQEEKEGTESGTILEVLQPGYKYHDKLLRAAMVKVAK